MSKNDINYEDYRKDGYIFPIKIFYEKEALSYRNKLEKIEREFEFEGSLPLSLNTYKRINSQCVIPMACEIALNKRILDAVENVIGKNILIWSVEFFIKEPKSKSIVSMHQDLTYWGLDNNEYQVTAWLALSISNKSSGCMDFVKESFRNPILPHNDTFSKDNLLSRGQEIKVDILEKDKVHITLKPGEMSLHHGLTIHGSGQNISNDRRIGIAIRYLNPKIKQIHADKDYAILARGEDKYNHFMKYEPPTSLFSKKDLDFHLHLRKVQSKALTKGSRKGVNLYQGNREIA